MPDLPDLNLTTRWHIRCSWCTKTQPLIDDHDLSVQLARSVGWRTLELDNGVVLQVCRDCAHTISRERTPS
ncbi:hypothetical protein ACQBAU_16160 [Propionibacteriaceae bacterium Y2011]